MKYSGSEVMYAYKESKSKSKQFTIKNHNLNQVEQQITIKSIHPFKFKIFNSEMIFLFGTTL